MALAIGSLAVVSALVLSGCSSSSGSGSSQGPVSQADINKAMNAKSSITFWSWLPDVQNEIKLFEKKYPKITVNYSNAGQGTPEYTHLRTAIKAGSGAPDVVQVEYQYLPSFQSDLLDMTPYGGAKLSKLFSPTIWKQVALNGSVLGIPQDTSPMGNLYRADVLNSAGISSAPTTWTQYEADAKTLKSKTSNYISDLPPNDGGQFLALLWQAGARPFSYDGKKTVGVNLQTADDKKVADYWTSMIQQGLVDNSPDFDNDWFQSFASGKYAGWLAPSWGPDQIISSVKSSAGKWRAAALPQWDPSNPASSYNGGSSLAITKQSKNPIVAYEFAKFMDTDHESVLKMTTSTQSLYPASLSGLSDPAWINNKVPFFGGQQVNKLFNDISKTVDPKFQWLPFMDYAYTQYNSTVGKAIADKTSIYAGLKAWQTSLLTYAKQQGYTIKSNG
jgi:multiple sugar transport system substrate-binding protein